MIIAVTNAIYAFTAQLVRALHRYREVSGSNPVEVLNFIAIIAYLLMIFLVMSCYLSNSKRLEKFRPERDSSPDFANAGAVEQPGQLVLGADHYLSL